MPNLCPACLKDARDPAFDGEGHWCARHGATGLRAARSILHKLRALPEHERRAACSWLAEWGGVDVAAWAMRPADDDAGPLPFELDRLSEPT